MIKLNIGCGNRKIDGYVGVDVVKRPAADIVAPAHKIPLASGTVEEVMAIHIVEHVYEWETNDLLREWFRLLKPNGRLVLEMPDLLKACRNILDGVKGKHPDQMGMWPLFGDPRDKDPLMCHHWAWTFTTLAPRVRAIGFVDIVEKETEFHLRGKGIRDFRLEARKP